jgi:hypothetical protein
MKFIVTSKRIIDYPSGSAVSVGQAVDAFLREAHGKGEDISALTLDFEHDEVGSLVHPAQTKGMPKAR